MASRPEIDLACPKVNVIRPYLFGTVDVIPMDNGFSFRRFGGVGDGQHNRTVLFLRQTLHIIPEHFCDYLPGYPL
jgi:hypothetical protein